MWGKCRVSVGGVKSVKGGVGKCWERFEKAWREV